MQTSSGWGKLIPSWKLPSLKLTACPWKWMVGILLPYWDGLFSGATLVSGRVTYPFPKALLSRWFSFSRLVGYVSSLEGSDLREKMKQRLKAFKGFGESGPPQNFPHIFPDFFFEIFLFETKPWPKNLGPRSWTTMVEDDESSQILEKWWSQMVVANPWFIGLQRARWICQV